VSGWLAPPVPAGGFVLELLFPQPENWLASRPARLTTRKGRFILIPL
jgi:hypothetical protein